MTSIEVAQRVVAEKSCYLFRQRDDGTYDAKPYFTGSKRGWVALDLYSASAVMAVYNGLNEQNRASYAKLPLVKAAKLAFKFIK